MKIVTGTLVKFRSLYEKNRWFHGKVYGVVDGYALIKDPKGKMYPQFVLLERLMDPKAIEIEL